MTSQFATSNQQLNLPLSVFYVPFASRYRLSVAYGLKVAKPSPFPNTICGNLRHLRTNPSAISRNNPEISKPPHHTFFTKQSTHSADNQNLYTPVPPQGILLLTPYLFLTCHDLP